MIKGFLISLLFASTLALEPIVVKGNKFFLEKSKKEFRIKGIGYQPRGTTKGTKDDPLSHPDRCKRDVALFKELGLNMVRVYQVDPKNNHDECMKLLEDAGIYLALDLPIPDYSIDRSNPSYNLDILDHYKSNVDHFDKYDNIGLYFAGNEINDNSNNTDANPFVKAALRDIKAYVATKKHKVPVGYANNDDTRTRKNILEYFNCGKEEERAEFYAVNVYSWCNSKNFKSSGYPALIKDYEGYSLPIFLSEYGCNESRPREFVKELQSIYGPDMENYITGGIMYEYTEETNKYGIVKIDYSDDSVKKLQPEFDNFKKALANIEPNLVTMDSYKPKNTEPSVCPKSSSTWKSNEKLPETPSSSKCQCMVDSLGCKAKKDLDGDGKAIAKAFNFICGKIDCKKGIGANAMEGAYGPYSGCLPIDQLSWALNELYESEGKKDDICTGGGDGVGELQSPKGDITKCEGIKEDTGKSGSNGGKGSSSATTNSISAFFIASIFGTLLI